MPRWYSGLRSAQWGGGDPAQLAAKRLPRASTNVPLQPSHERRLRPGCHISGAQWPEAREVAVTCRPPRRAVRGHLAQGRGCVTLAVAAPSADAGLSVASAPSPSLCRNLLLPQAKARDDRHE
eukprot:CAMPEP_0183347270 /NCGR_PEP_ID=MMETSP0164_2-20130417/12137_1 /TAXON_ID=221442 /ORGANISM="Coccolithus pelagicus ssp braarudi, Strain PLY182g" /LENGTH=122 /DNA_ID=CAMNT_0025518663 /DNA_START=60 /DNA_END=426 /DNA_ORIENTATION=+